ncbi:MAG TPA: [FeFe] hydrogenase H-cluster radical SAM maturase HydE [Myxococcota bacterium]|nr:[FeFe] hydrogenase H-cluster radical SAM maturase HydE [Myxococcota bacterium]HOC99396.1 [FeFe] hydrogenase H-cluster radical SAM maturase HydE [Myxococcota bacterium]
MLDRDAVIAWLRESDQSRLFELFAWADRVRHETVGDAIHLRGLLEVSSFCVRQCAYCGINATNRTARRFRMDRDEILAAAREAKGYGYGTIVMQGGEDYGIKAEWMADIIRAMKQDVGLAITLSLGERRPDELKLWKEAGADRYLLRFETSDPALYRLIHPALPGGFEDRIQQIRMLQEIGYEAGSGVMVGIPGQSWDSLADDIMLFSTLDLDMIGVGPYIPHPDTPMGAWMLEGRGEVAFPKLPEGEQVPGNAETAFKVIALTRLLCPDSNIPSTTAIATLNREGGRRQGLMCGANVVMPNLTPAKYRECYEIYPNKATLVETAGVCARNLKDSFEQMGRFIGSGAGGRVRH